MKIRTGFVSNSSSSSFCIVGVCLEEGEVRDLLGDFKSEEEGEEEDFRELVDEYLDSKKSKLYIQHDYESQIYWFGNSIFSMKKDETMGQFKERTQEEIKKVFPKLKKKAELTVEYIYN